MVYTHWKSYTPRKYKINLIKCLLHRAWNTCSNREKFDEDVSTINDNLLKNQYPSGLIKATVKNFIDRVENPNRDEKPQIAEKKEVLLLLPYYGTLSESFEKTLKSLVHKAYQQVVLRIVYKTTFRLSDLFKLKGRIPKRLLSHVVYGVCCSDCPDTYVGKTKRNLITRFNEHLNAKKVSGR